MDWNRGVSVQDSQWCHGAPCLPRERRSALEHFQGTGDSACGEVRKVNGLSFTLGAWGSSPLLLWFLFPLGGRAGWRDPLRVIMGSSAAFGG